MSNPDTGRPWQVDDRVMWRWREPAATLAETYGKITAIKSDGSVMVRFDDGSEEQCDASDLQEEGNPHGQD